MSLIRSKDAAIYYEEHGAGETLILLPGLLGTIESHWRRFIPEFAKQFHVVAVDLRGHGRTNNPSEQLRLHQLVADLSALCETLGIERARICGYSLGGYIGLAFGIQHPGSVQSLLMHATKFFWTPQAVATAAADFVPEKILEKVPQWAAQLRQDHAPANGEEGWKGLLNAAKDFLGTMPVEGLTANALAMATFPVLVSVGDADEMVPREEAAQLAARLPQGTLHVFTATRHPMQFVRKESFLEVARSFFEKNSTPEDTRLDILEKF
jgi:pimeloyl-ACP methyl ester carboxylesterase